MSTWSRSLSFCLGLVYVVIPRAGLCADAGLDAALTGGDAAARDGSTGSLDGAPPTLPPPTHVVGTACTKDADCAEGLTCLLASGNALGVGGPPGGLCTIDCTAKQQAGCDAVDTGSLCTSTGRSTTLYCFETCEIGNVDAGVPKCHGRDDEACSPTQTGATFCAPLCRDDADCGGRACDPTTGLCGAPATGTLPLGTACDPIASQTDCIGTCSQLGSGMGTLDNSFCSTQCTLGKDHGCGQTENGSGPPRAACVFKFDSSEGEGDVGECAELCDCDSDCSNPGFVCSPKTGEGAGRSGACVPKLTFNGLTQGIPCGSPSTDAGPPDAGAAKGKVDASPDGSDGSLSATGGCNCRAASGDERRDPFTAPIALAALGALALARRRSARGYHATAPEPCRNERDTRLS